MTETTNNGAGENTDPVKAKGKAKGNEAQAETLDSLFARLRKLEQAVYGKTPRLDPNYKPENQKFVKVKVLKPFTHKKVVQNIGDIITIPEDAALLEAGFIEIAGGK